MTAADDDELVRNPEQADEAPESVLPAPQFTPPNVGELITSSDTGNTYTIGPALGEGSFGYVYECTDSWDNELAVKILKPRGTYEEIREKAVAEFWIYGVRVKNKNWCDQ